MQIRPFEPADRDAVIALWRRCGLTRPWNDPEKDIARKLAVRGDWFLVGEEDGEVVASVMAGYDGHRGWIYYLAVAPERRGKGLGAQIVGRAEALLAEAGCPKINLQIRADNAEAAGFYRALGYRRDEVVSYGKRLVPD